MEHLQYPIGKFQMPHPVSKSNRQAAISEFSSMPEKLEALLEGMRDDQLNRTYRENGWTIRQLVHHLADSHMNMSIRLKHALTEENFTIRPYNEKEWANLGDMGTTDIAVSIQILKGIHTRITNIFSSLDETQWQRILHHPERGPLTVEELLFKYVWHGNHHLAHIRITKEKS